jgi:cytochrome c5
MAPRRILYPLVVITLFFVVVAGATGNNSTSAPVVLGLASAAAQSPKRDGEAILNASCNGCHDMTVIQTSAKSQEEWEQTLEQMIQRGAKVSAEDRPILLTYLVRAHGPMPNGPGKDIVLNTCTICHDLSRVKRSMHTEEEWEGTLIAMLNEGAPLSDDDFPIVLAYLTKNFGVR